MKQFFPFLFSVLLVFTASAQKKVTFAKYSDKELEMNKVSFEPSAKAVILDENGSLEFLSKKYITSIHRRLKIFDQSETDRGVIRVQYNPNTEEITNIKGVTTTILRGVPLVSKLRNDQITERKISEDLSEIVITMPQVKRGSIVEYMYKKKTKVLFKPEDWNFQHDIPTIYSAYQQSLNLPEDFDFLASFQGSRALREEIYQGVVTEDDELAQQRVGIGVEGATKPIGYRWWKMENVVSLKNNDSFLLSNVDFIEKAVFRNPDNVENLGSWENFMIDYMQKDNVIGLLNGNNGEVEAIVKKLTLTGASDKEKLAKIQQAIAGAYEWSGERSIYPGKNNNSADVNLRLYAALKPVFPESRLVLLSTPENGTIYQGYPLKKPFDHVVVKVEIGNKTYFLDATEKNLPYTVLPYYSQNRVGLIVQKNKQWVDVKSAGNWQNNIYQQITFDGKDLNKVFNVKWNEQRSVKYRDQLSQGENDFVREAFSIPTTREIKGFQTNAKSEIKGPLTTKFSYSLTDYLKDQDKIYINAIEFTELLNNPIVAETRYYPVQFQILPAIQVTSIIEIPEGYAVEKLPESQIIALPDNYGKFTYNAVNMNGKINLTVRFEISKNNLPADMYSALKEYYGTVTEKCEEPIVLSKK
ncbi:MAG: DUF3857 domain-containing protein [Cyclobacteriaceae bacterium]